ncbi:glycosyltransferase family 87 protein [Vogesella sp. LIG4]|uniref:glycosyltransferase family 87 protein n=1 Tax=Vogesella sp. LIG4 TaxID=1192162 RepID=UPI0008202360|nr:glycosyltransferase family 87 protein [Vogesella sp. LIG4]SCK15347.1 Protein of unknown function [Vogesella sp. LIG4]
MTRRRIFLLGFLALLLLGVGLSCVYRVAWSDIQRTDYTVYTAAGQALLNHGDLYSAQNVRGWKYVYPPPFALLMVPFARMSLASGALLWYLLEIAAIAAVSIMSVRLLPATVPDRHKDLLYGLPLASLCVILVSGAMRCQASVFMFALMVATFYLHFRGRPIAAGASLAGAILMKVFPAVLVAYFIWRRQWRVLLATAASLLVMGLLLPGLALGWRQNLHDDARWVEVVAAPALMSNHERASSTPLFEQLMDTTKPRNQSLEAMFLSAGLGAESSKRLVTLSGGLMLLAMLLASRRVQNRHDELALAGAFLSWSLLVPPISEAHYFGALILPLTVLLGRILYEATACSRQQRQLAILLCGGTMLAAMRLLSWERTETLRPLGLATLLVWGACLYSIMRHDKRHIWPEGPHKQSGAHTMYGY